MTERRGETDDGVGMIGIKGIDVFSSYYSGSH
jgi:hypothetical protein